MIVRHCGTIEGDERRPSKQKDNSCTPQCACDLGSHLPEYHDPERCAETASRSCEEFLGAQNRNVRRRGGRGRGRKSPTMLPLRHRPYLRSRRGHPKLATAMPASQSARQPTASQHKWRRSYQLSWPACAALARGKRPARQLPAVSTIAARVPPRQTDGAHRDAGVRTTTRSASSAQTAPTTNRVACVTVTNAFSSARISRAWCLSLQASRS